jgi:threonine/homoserine/homoserine lactone efflux protein
LSRPSKFKTRRAAAGVRSFSPRTAQVRVLQRGGRVFIEPRCVGPQHQQRDRVSLELNRHSYLLRISSHHLFFGATMGINFAAFLGVSLFVIMSPGPDTALTIRNTLVGGRGAGIATAFGVVTGLATWTVASSAGLAALLVASQPLFLAVRLGGAAYLVFLGLQALRSAVFTKGDLGAPVKAGVRTRLRRSSAFRQGVISNLSNPKIVVFFLSLLPQFIDRGQASFTRLLFLGLIFCAITVSWLTLYAVVVARVGDFLRRDRVRRGLEAVTGLALVGLGLKLATDRR